MTNKDIALKILFSRLNHFSGMIRERACDEIANLIAKSKNDQVIDELYTWSKIQLLESMNILTLIILIRVKDINPSFKFISADDLIKLLPTFSPLHYILLTELYGDLITENMLDYNFTDLTTKEVTVDEFFLKHVENFLPPIYYDHAKKINEKYNYDFIKQWGLEWTYHVNSQGIKPNRSIDNYWGRSDDLHYVAYDPILSEIYRSTFLRAINWAIKIHNLPFIKGMIYSLQALPIDFNLWNLESTPKPKWLSFKKKNASTFDVNHNQIWDSIESKWNSQKKQKNIIAQISTLVQDKDISTEIEIYGIFQRTVGETKPDLDKLTRSLKWDNSLNKGGGLIRFGGELKGSNFEDWIHEFEDWDIVPTYIMAFPMNSPRWQWWRMYRNLWFPAFYFFEVTTNIAIEKEKISFTDLSDKKEFAYWVDWVNGISEKTTANLPPNTGQALYIRTNLINKIEELTNFKFCWICKLTSYTRKHSIGKFEKYSYYKTFGESTIIH